MASKIQSALPAHLKSSALSNGNGDADGSFARKHHGKTQSHVVSWTASLFSMLEIYPYQLHICDPTLNVAAGASLCIRY